MPSECTIPAATAASCNRTTEWPELWGLWMDEGGWVIANDGPCDGPHVFWTREEAEATAADVSHNYDIPCRPRQVYTAPREKFIDDDKENGHA